MQQCSRDLLGMTKNLLIYFFGVDVIGSFLLAPFCGVVSRTLLAPVCFLTLAFFSFWLNSTAGTDSIFSTCPIKASSPKSYSTSPLSVFTKQPSFRKFGNVALGIPTVSKYLIWHRKVRKACLMLKLEASRVEDFLHSLGMNSSEAVLILDGLLQVSVSQDQISLDSTYI